MTNKDLDSRVCPAYFYVCPSTTVEKSRKQVVYKAMQTASSKEMTINNETFLMCKVN